MMKDMKILLKNKGKKKLKIRILFKNYNRKLKIKKQRFLRNINRR